MGLLNFEGGEILLIVVGIVAMLLAYLLGGKRITLPDMPSQIVTVSDAGDMLLTAVTVAQQLVGAAEQLWLTGKLPKESRYNWVYDKMAETFPELNAGQLIALIEGAVFWLKVATDAPTREGMEQTLREFNLGGGR